MRAFVTGSTGLLGNSIVAELLARGLEVGALARKPEAAQLVPARAHLVVGDLRDVGGFEKSLEGSDVLVHAAACYGEFYRAKAQSPDEINVRGTNDLLEAAVRRGVRNIIYISSAGVLETAKKEVVDETCPYSSSPGDPYFASKVSSEKAVLRFAQGHPEVRVVLLLPSVMMGPGDAGPTPTGAFVQKILRGELAFILPGYHRIVDARDVARAAAEAITKGESGERYLLGGPRYPVVEIFRAVSAASARPMPSKTISPGKLLFASRLMHLASKVTGREPPIRPNIVRHLQETFVYSSQKAERDLGLGFRPLSETVTDTVRWFDARWRAIP
jgi:nucleoside-diphosphate-sugar epimerase